MSEFLDLSGNSGRRESSLAAQIKAARQDAGKSIEEVVNATQISVVFLHYLENAEYEKMPAMVYSLGMAENLLEFLQLGEDEKKRLLTELEESMFPFEAAKGDHIPYFLNKSKERASSVRKEKNINTLEDAATNGSGSGSGAATKDSAGQQSSLGGEKSVQQRISAEQQKKVFTSSGYSQPPNKRPPINSKKNLVVILLIAASLVVVGLLLFIAYQYNALRVNKASNGEIDMLGEEQEISTHTLFDKFDTFELREGDVVRVFIGSALKQFQVERISARDIIFSIGNFRSYNLLLRDEVSLDFNEDSLAELTVKFQRVNGEVGVVYFESGSFEEDKLDYEKIWQLEEKIQVTKNHTLIKNSDKSLIKIFIKATTLPVYLSYNIDGRRQNTFSLLPGEDILITVESHIELQVGNYRTAEVVVNSFPLQLWAGGSSKYSTTRIIKWLRSPYNETLHDLVIQDYVN